MKINFTKMHGLGNDFMIIENVHQKFLPTPELIRKWSKRNTGVGFDQLLLVEAAINKNVDFNYRIFNADGKEVFQCGNGARCLAVFLRDEKLINKNLIKVATQNNILELQIDSDNQVTVNMGVPNFDPKKIPFLIDQEKLTYELTVENRKLAVVPANTFDALLKGDSKRVEKLEISALSIGNPHCILLVDDIKTAPVDTLGALLTNHPLFPESVNVEFMQVNNPEEIQLRVFERGVGETLACGSGACAAVIAGRKLGLLEEAVTVKQLGGALKVNWKRGGAVFLTGPAVKVFSGVIQVSI